MVEYDPKTSWGKIIRYSKQNPDEYETVGDLIQGQAAIIERLMELQAVEPDKGRYGYLWKWVRRDKITKIRSD